MTEQALFEKAVELFDAANSQDPNKQSADGKEWPKELLYSHRMSDMLERYSPDADAVMKLAIRAQHIERWKSPRSDYPMDRVGYLKWRTDLYKFHADTLGRLMAEAGYAESDIERAKKAVGKKAIKSNPDTQLLEDVVDLVFIEHYMLGFAERHPEYSEEKWLDIIRKTWKKMSERGQAFALGRPCQCADVAGMPVPRIGAVGAIAHVDAVSSCAREHLAVRRPCQMFGPEFVAGERLQPLTGLCVEQFYPAVFTGGGQLTTVRLGAYTDHSPLVRLRREQPVTVGLVGIERAIGAARIDDVAFRTPREVRQALAEYIGPIQHSGTHVSGLR